jgi:hypothetical protein
VNFSTFSNELPNKTLFVILFKNTRLTCEIDGLNALREKKKKKKKKNLKGQEEA